MMKALIEKYFNGETTLEEEAQLKAYFRNGEVDETLRQYAPLFRYLEQEKAQLLDSDFDQKLTARLQKGATVVGMRPWQRQLLRVAAVGILLAGLFLLFQRKPASHTAIHWEKYETQDPELAYEQTKEALRLLSSKLKRGSKKAVDEMSKTEKMSKFLN
jgi:hypothetical protein